MKLGMIFLGLAILLLGGGFAAVALSDIPVTPQNVTKTIPSDRFLNGR